MAWNIPTPFSYLFLLVTKQVNKGVIYRRVEISFLSPEKEITKEIVDRVNLLYVETGQIIENGSFKKALEKVFELVRYANRYFDEQQPWKQVHENSEACKQTLGDCVYIIANLANILTPFLPFSSEKVKGMLYVTAQSWEPLLVKRLFLLLGPAFMIFIGLQVLESVIIAFLLFYSWLLTVPLLAGGVPWIRFKTTSREVLWEFGSGLLFFLFIYGGLLWLHDYFINIDQLRNLLWEWGFSAQSEIFLVMVLLMANPILEEVYWRGFIYEKLRKEGTAKFAILMTAAFYTLYHLLSVIPIFTRFYGLAAVIPVFIAGLIWGCMREKSGSIIAAMIGHVLGDMGIILVYWLIIR